MSAPAASSSVSKGDQSQHQQPHNNHQQHQQHHMYSPGSKVIVTRPAKTQRQSMRYTGGYSYSSGGHITTAASNNISSLVSKSARPVSSIADAGVGDGGDSQRTTKSSKALKPLIPSAISNAISMRRRPLPRDYDPNVLSAYAVLMWLLTANRRNNRFAQQTEPGTTNSMNE